MLVRDSGSEEPAEVCLPTGTVLSVYISWLRS
uniref:Uncharacterized protein n=1 Tax=Anguilla anguilla TaxID=7936 RepID=A0A0E9TFI4_ANGAN